MAPTEEGAALAGDCLAVCSLVILCDAIIQCLESCFNDCGRIGVPLDSFGLLLSVNVVPSVVFIHGYWGPSAFGMTGAAMGSGDAICVMHILVRSQWLFRVPATALAELHFGLPAVWVL